MTWIGAAPIAIGGIGGIGAKERPTFGPMPPMVPMVFARICPLERVGRRAPVTKRCLARQHEAGHASASKSLELNCEVLTPPTLRV